MGAAGAAVCQLEHVPLVVAKPKSNGAPENYVAVLRSVINVEQRATGPHTSAAARAAAEAD